MVAAGKVAGAPEGTKEFKIIIHMKRMQYTVLCAAFFVAGCLVAG
jgi:hypothetical protein